MPLGCECSYGFCSMRMIEHRDPDSWSFSSLPRATNPGFSSCSLAHYALHPPEHRVSGCKQDFVCGAFKRLSASPAWQTETLLLSQLDIISFPVLVLWAREPSLGFRPHNSPGKSHWPLKYLSGTSASAPGSLASPLTPSLHPYQSHCGEVVSFVCLGYKASL